MCLGTNGHILVYLGIFGYICCICWYIWGIFGGNFYRSEVLTERDISSLGVRTGGWVEVDVSAVAVAAAAFVALGESLIDLGESLIEKSESGVRMVRMREEWISV